LLTIFTIPKPFEGHTDIIQRNAIRSWGLLRPACEIMLIGDEKGTSRAASEFGAVYRPAVKRNEYGTPLLDSIFKTASDNSKYSILCYINADIILMSDFMRAYDHVKDMDSFLMIGKRWDIDIQEIIDFSNPAWEGELRSLVSREGVQRPSTWIDYFVFNRGLWGDSIPSFAVGRTSYDRWLIYRAKKERVPVIDATSSVMAIHQNHSYHPAVLTRENGRWKGPEVPYNQELAGKYAVNFNIDDADLALVDGELRGRGAAVRARRFIATRFPGLARGAVRAARRVGLYPQEEKDVVAERTIKDRVDS